MQWKIARLTPVSAFGSTLRGDMIFGQLCWAIRNRFGESFLNSLLEDYTSGQPFVVVSDAFPKGYLPKPSLPFLFSKSAGHLENRKEIKRRKWVAMEHFMRPLGEVFDAAVSEEAIIGGFRTALHFHNSVSRSTGTTGASFDPYQTEYHWPNGEIILDLHILVDENRISSGDLRMALSDIGKTGFGRDSSTGLGRFDIADMEDWSRPASKNPNAFLTLAPSAPQGLKWDEDNCFYQLFVRFGRHGDVGALSRVPFKQPIFMADTGAVLSPLQEAPSALFTGQGLGGDGSISKVLPETVHQGYAPVIPVHLPVRKSAL